MRNAILAVATIFVLGMGTIPTIAADENKGTQTKSEMDNTNSANKQECDAILANRSTHTEADIKRCEATKQQ
jgi:hypothetical protein